MKKLIFTVLFLFLLFTGFWYYSEHRIENFVADKLNRAEETLQKKGFSLKHEGFFISGFPFGYNIKLKNPSITKLQENKEDEGLTKASLDGDLSLTSNLLGTTFTLKKEGNSKLTLKGFQRGNSRPQQFISSGISSFTFSAEEKSYLEALKNPFKTLTDLIEKNDKEFLVGKTGKLHLKDVKFSNAENETLPLVEVDNAEISYAISHVNEKEMGFSLFGNIKGLNLDTLIMGTDSFTPGNERSLKEIALLLSMPKPGKTDAIFDLELKGPTSNHNVNAYTSFADLPSFSIDLKKGTITNNFGTHSLNGETFLTDVKDGKRKLHHSLLSTFENSKEQFKALRSSWEDFLNNLPICQEGTNVALSPGCPLIKSLIPKFDTFGKITFQTDLDFDVGNVKEPLDDSKLFVRHLDYFAEIYGLKSEGQAEFKQPGIKAVYKINLVNYQDLFHDLFNYLNKLGQFLPYLTEEANSLPKLSESQVTLILDYLKAISDEPKKELKDIRITIDVNGPDSFKIGTLPASEFENKTTELAQKLSQELKAAPKKQEGEAK